MIANLPFYLEKADLLAELPQFSSIYFTTDELSCFLNSLQSYRLTQENEASLEKLLSAPRKKQILNELFHFTRTFPLIRNAKQAFAIYISLGEIIPWTRHPFMRRLLAVSYQEAKVSLFKKI
ncbi:MAG: hypothetical protein QHH75_00755 [Bacillota bacterium]|nr:hypothetical protein [Bacillota bacterium]